jgi:hypothetical protein
MEIAQQMKAEKYFHSRLHGSFRYMTMITTMIKGARRPEATG